MARIAAWLLVSFALVGAAGVASASPGSGVADRWLTARAKAQPIEDDGSGRAELSVVLLERPEVDLPVSIRLRSETVELPENRLGWDDVVDAKAGQPRFRTTLPRPAEAGEHLIEAQVSYVVCGARWCREKRGRVSWTLAVDGDASTSSSERRTP